MFYTSTGKSLTLNEGYEVLIEMRRQANQLILDKLEEKKDIKTVAEMFRVSKSVVSDVKKGFLISCIEMSFKILSHN
jgi:hypothetical protein